MRNPIQPEPMRGPVLSRWDLLPLLGAVGLLLLCQRLWARLPDSLPTHFGSDGRPNAWTPKAAAPWLMLGIPLAVWVLLLVIGTWATPPDPERVAVQRRIMAPMRALTVLGLFALLSSIVLIPVLGLWVFWPTLGAFLGLLFVGLGLLVRLGYLHAPEDERRLWRWGMFYVNPEDPRLWVPKRFGIGWTLNFARPWAWIVIGLLTLLPLFLWVFIWLSER